MANALDSFFRAKGQAMQQGQNMLAAEQGLQKMQRAKGLNDIISGAYTPDEGMNMQNALNAMYEGGYGREAMNLEASQAKLRGATPQDWKTAMLYQSATPEQRAAFDQTKRSQQWLNLGNRQVNTGTGQVRDINLKPGQEIDYLDKKAETAVTGRKRGEEKALLEDLQSSLPNLQNVASKLSELGKKATYTKAGQFADATARQAGFKVSEGAIARKEYISMVSNEILPLLRQTFGAAFTEKEGETLKATLGDADASPEEKDAVLKSFIAAKIAQIKTKQRRVGQQAPQSGAPQSAINYLMQNNNPIIQQQFKAKYGYLP